MITNSKIGVLMGGLSSERDISLSTGRLVTASLIKKGYSVAAIDIGRDLPQRLINEGIKVAFIALHGRYGEDGCVQGLLEVIGLLRPISGVSNSFFRLFITLTTQILDHHGISTP